MRSSCLATPSRAFAAERPSFAAGPGRLFSTPAIVFAARETAAGPIFSNRSSETIAGSVVGLEEVDEGVPLAAALVVLALVEADELAEALARAGVHVACAVLVDGLRRALEELGERDDHARRTPCRPG